MAKSSNKATEVEKIAAEEELSAVDNANSENAAVDEKEELLKTVEELRKKTESLEKQLEESKAAASSEKDSDLSRENVHFLFMAEVAEDNVLQIGENGRYGRIVGKTGSFYVPKRDLSSVLNEQIRSLLAKRWLIITSGLTDDEREAMEVNYADGEILEKKVFSKIVEMGDKILDIYPGLCEGHRKIVAQRYADAYEKGNHSISRDTVIALNNMSKTEKNPQGDFVSIIKSMNEKDLEA